MPREIEFKYGGERDSCIPKFHMRAVEDKEASDAAGHPIFKDVPYVKVFAPGNSKEIPNFRVEQKHKDRWPEQWKAFELGEEAPLNGFPLDQWPQITRGACETLKGYGIRTVEELAASTDENARTMGAQYVGLRYQAEKFLKDHGSEKARISELEGQNENLMKRLEALEAGVEPKDGPTEAQLETLEKARAAKAAKAKAKG